MLAFLSTMYVDGRQSTASEIADGQTLNCIFVHQDECYQNQRRTAKMGVVRFGKARLSVMVDNIQEQLAVKKRVYKMLAPP
jgi:hypothetical protein